jgi:hypothetical protein
LVDILDLPVILVVVNLVQHLVGVLIIVLPLLEQKD